LLIISRQLYNIIVVKTDPFDLLSSLRAVSFGSLLEAVFNHFYFVCYKTYLLYLSPMIVRIVKMEFKPEEVENFKQLFENKKQHIRAFPGCNHLELLQGTSANTSVFMTYSYWNSEEDLNNYRYSDLFAETWKATKMMFSRKAEAISLNKLHELA